MEDIRDEQIEKVIIKHEWLQIGALIVTVGGLFLWNHSEMHSNQRETSALINAIREDAKEFRERWAEETKNFHGRVCPRMELI